MRTLLLATAFAALLPFATGAQAAENYRFVVVSKTVHPWFDIVVDGAKAAAKMLHEQTGGNFKIEYLAPTSANVVEQNDLVERAIATHPDGIMIDEDDPGANKPVLQEALNQKIPVVIFDNFGINKDLGVPVMGNDLCQQAADEANDLAKLIGDKGEVAVMLGVPTAPTHATRARCGVAALKKYPDIKIVAQGIDNDSIEQAQQQAATIMQAHPNLKGWITASGSGPIGIGQAIEEAHKVGKVQFIGTDNLKEMVDLVNKGVTPMSLSTNPFMQGYWSTIIMWQKKLGQPGPAVFDTGYYTILPVKK
jgi:ribose transport system substrate-binding protein